MKTRRLLQRLVVSMGIRDRLNMVTSSPAAAATASPRCPTSHSVPISVSVIGRAFLAPARRRARGGADHMKGQGASRTARQRLDRQSLDDIRAARLLREHRELRREVFAVGVPMRRTVDGEIVSFKTGIVPAFIGEEGAARGDLGPRLVAMVRNIEAR